jgi:hypothetical protein
MSAIPLTRLRAVPPRKQANSGEFDEADEVCEQLVVSGCDAAELFELVEEALNDVALLVELGVVRPLERPVPLGRNDGLADAFSDPAAQVIGVVALVRDGDVRGEALDQFVRESDVVVLAASRSGAPACQAYRRRRGFCAQAAAGATKALGIRPL